MDSWYLNFITLSIMHLLSRGRNHLKTAIALLVNKQSATFPLREKSGFSPPNPHTPWLGQSKVLKHLREDEIRQRKLQTLASYSRNLVGVGTFDDPQARDFCKQIDQQPNDVRTELCGCLLKLKTLAIQFF